ncbi:hypothetical protein M8C21_010954 [Ambrosia artemisiifolia]|uniref:Uncharacterized protein n=1 Tax=Ambrosia artemisiifolia TaxID=4212 RepID=A0AAD5D927_AMBAR|nr:hypothetical protein M8C21_010954 [Ambrosia artemisiifolia]
MSQLTQPKKMVSGWRKVFCTSIPHEPNPNPIEDHEDDHQLSNCTRFRFFSSSSSNPSTPRLRCRTTAAVPSPSPSTPLSPRVFNTPSPCSPSSFSFIKSSLRLRPQKRCGICLQSMKKGNGTASFTAECSHAFHFPCVSDYVTTQGSLACPVCSCLWKDMPLLTVNQGRYTNQLHTLCDEENSREKLSTRFIEDVVDAHEYMKEKRRHKRPDLKVYNDDEPLAVLTPKVRFNPIPESDENNDEELEIYNNDASLEVRMSPETAVIAASGRHLTYGIVLNLKAELKKEKPHLRAPIDLVAVIDVTGKTTSENLQKMKRTMRSIVSLLSSSDRLSIVAFSSHSKRLLGLRRMTTSGKRAVLAIVEAMAILEGFSNSNDAVKKAVKVLLDRSENNTLAAVILLSNDRYSHSRFSFPIHSVNLRRDEEYVTRKLIEKVLNVSVQEVRLQLGIVSGTSVISTVLDPKTTSIFGSSTVEIGEMSANEERELLVEIKLPLAAVRVNQVLSVQCSYRESLTQEMIYGQQQTLTVPHPTIVRSSSCPPTIQRLRNMFISARALAEARRLTEGNDLAGACNVLVSAYGLIKRSSGGDNEFVLGLEAELSELQRRRKAQVRARAQETVVCNMDGKGEPLTPTSAWRMADKLAKAAMMRKSVNRVSDLHGFEDARF